MRTIFIIPPTTPTNSGEIVSRAGGRFKLTDSNVGPVDALLTGFSLNTHCKLTGKGGEGREGGKDGVRAGRGKVRVGLEPKHFSGNVISHGR